MVVIRLSRSGQKGTPIYKVIVQDKDAPQGGRFIEQLGTLRLDTHKKSEQKIAERYVLDVKNERYAHWVKLGAQPSPRLKKWAKEFKVLADAAAEAPQAPAKEKAAAPKSAKAPAKAAAKSKK